MPTQPQDYENLVEKLFDDRLSEAERQQLNAVLRQSAEAREYFWHLVMLEGHLVDLTGWIVGQQYATELAFSETLEAFIEMESAAEAELQSYPPVPDLLIEKEPVTWRDVRSAGAYCIRSLARQKATWGVAAAAMICIVGLVYTTWFGGDSSQSTSQPIADWDQDTPAVAQLPSEPVPVAVVMNQSLATNTTDNHLASGTELYPGHIIALQAGSSMQLECWSGATVILQGPGEYKLHSAERVGMRHGRISAVVPPQAKGFTVSTAKTDFIDHGTEFTVVLDKEGHGEVVVLDGLIEAKPARTESQQSFNKPQSVMLHEGFGGHLVPDEVIPQSVQPIDATQAERYTRNWDDVVYRPVLSGEITYTPSPPASLTLGQSTSTDPLLIPEQRGVVLTEDLYLNADKTNKSVIEKLGLEIEPQEDYVIAAGTKLNSFLIHFDLPEQKTQGTVERDFKLRFNGRIVGVVEMQQHQVATDGVVGLASIQYPATGTLRGASDPPGHPNFDHIYISDDLRTMSVKMRLSGMDQIRVLVENTDP